LFGLPLILALFIVVIVLIAVIFGVGGGLFGAVPSFLIFDHPVLATSAFLFVIGIPVVALIYAIIAHFAKWKPLNNPVKFTFLLIWILSLALLVFSGFRFNKSSWKENWNWRREIGNAVRGNGIFSEKSYDITDRVENLKISGFLPASFQIEQIQDTTLSIKISGDENLVNQVKYEIENGWLSLSAFTQLRSENNLTILIKTNELKAIRSNAVGNIRINNTFTGDELFIDMKGPSKFEANNLFVQSLRVRAEGIASVHVSGKANSARFDLAGAGSIEAFELVSDSVYASVEGVGSIQCNPTEYLEGKLKGIGKITYKEEPKMKNVTSEGIGKIGRE
jgi:hypothetical protein